MHSAGNYRERRVRTWEGRWGGSRVVGVFVYILGGIVLLVLPRYTPMPPSDHGMAEGRF